MFRSSLKLNSGKFSAMHQGLGIPLNHEWEAVLIDIYAHTLFSILTEGAYPIRFTLPQLVKNKAHLS